MNSKGKAILSVIVIIVIVLLIANYQKIFKKVIPPKPVIVSTTADDTSSKLFDYSMKVVCEVSNRGGDGYIVIEVIVHQDGKEWKKTKSIYLQSYQTIKSEIVFDEIKLLAESPKYSVTAYPLGMPH